MTTRNWSPDEHENVIDAQNRQIALRNRALAIQAKKSEDVPGLFELWSAEDEPIVI